MCSVKWCGKTSKNSSYLKNGITFHRFPTCPETKSKWIDATGRDGWFPTKHSSICSRHFTEDSFHLMKNRRRVMDSAVPTIYLPTLAPTPINKQNEDEHFMKITKFQLLNACKESIASNVPLQDTDMPSTAENTLCVCDTLVKINERSLATHTLALETADTPSAFDTMDLVKKRLSRRIIELDNIVKIKNKELRKFRDSNRRLKIKIVKLESSLAELKQKLEA